jgi:hypothetical protein
MCYDNVGAIGLWVLHGGLSGLHACGIFLIRGCESYWLCNRFACEAPDMEGT